MFSAKGSGSGTPRSRVRKGRTCQVGGWGSGASRVRDRALVGFGIEGDGRPPSLGLGTTAFRVQKPECTD